ncbi:MAG: F0F1 ATP synthase subunit A [Solirubrobacterales bacterium]|nr:F0F1 ATP synthase subunit A [Solirubrobacterales bacterium]MBV9534202.1 F0F1 ATP synthase subunit A [Solirubrobacterales bacterium]
MSFVQNMSTRAKIGWGFLIAWLGGTIVFAIAYGITSHKAASIVSGQFSPIDEFRLDTWFKIGPIAINKGVLFILLAAVLTVGIMFWVARQMQIRRPNRVQVAVEWFYDFTRQMTSENMDDRLARKYFPLVATLFVFILVTNLIGYIPLPLETSNTFNLFGVHVPSFQIYAADTNVAFPLILAAMVFLLFNYEGVRYHGPIGYVKSLIPGGVGRGILPLIVVIEILSVFLRLLSLTIRLWANLLAGHLLIAFMGGELGVLVGLPFISWFLLPLGVLIFVFEATLIAGLQAFIFAILTAIYIGDSVHGHN